MLLWIKKLVLFSSLFSSSLFVFAAHEQRLFLSRDTPVVLRGLFKEELNGKFGTIVGFTRYNQYKVHITSYGNLTIVVDPAYLQRRIASKVLLKNPPKGYLYLRGKIGKIVRYKKEDQAYFVSFKEAAKEEVIIKVAERNLKNYTSFYSPLNSYPWNSRGAKGSVSS